MSTNAYTGTSYRGIKKKINAYVNDKVSFKVNASRENKHKDNIDVR